MSLLRRRCLDDDQVQSLVAGALSPEEAAPLLAHVGACDLCRELVASMARGCTSPPAVADAPATSSHAQSTPIMPRGACVDRYVVQEHVGHGGMGVVYAAYDPKLDRRVALKLVRTDRAHSEQMRQRLVREARVMGRVSHPGVLTVYDAGIVDEQVFIAMELVEGSTLAAWLRAAPRSWRDVVARFVDAGRGLAAAHALGIVHRDFKPDNVLVGKDGRIRVVDFGLAVANEEATRAEPTSSATPAVDLSERFTAYGGLAGTPAYMAPEQRLAGAVDARTDQYSFCVALHEALDGARPGGVAGGSAVGEARRALGHVPGGVRRAIVRGLSPSPSARFASMDALIAELERRAASRVRRTAALVALALGATALAGGAAIARRPARDLATHGFASAVHRLTYAPGCEEYPSFVARGGVVVFDGEADGTQQLFTFDTAMGNTRQLTSGPGVHRTALVSPDGRRVAYEHRLDGPRELRLKQLDGAGDERSLGPGSTMGGSWLDDHRLAVIDSSGAIIELDVDAAEAAARRPLYPDPKRRFGLTAPFSDGAVAAAWWNPPNGVALGILSSSGVSVLVDHMPYVDGALRVAPTEDAIYYARRAGAANELVRMPRRGGAPQVVRGGVTPARGLAISSDGGRLVFSTCAAYAQLARVGDGPSPTPIFRRQPWSDSAPFPIDARRVLFASDRSGHDQLYVADMSGDGEAHAVTGLDVEAGSPSRDGRWIAYSARDAGGLWLLAVDESAPPRRLTDGAHDETPVFSRDGATIFFVRDGGILAVPRTGGEPRLVAAKGLEPAPSRVDDRLFFLRRAQAPARAQIMTTDAHGAVAPLDVVLPPGNFWSLTASPDGKTLAMVHEGFEILEVPLDGSGPARVRTRLPRWISSLHYTFAGEALLASLESLDGDLWIAEGDFR